MKELSFAFWPLLFGLAIRLIYCVFLCFLWNFLASSYSSCWGSLTELRERHKVIIINLCIFGVYIHHMNLRVKNTADNIVFWILFKTCQRIAVQEGERGDKWTKMNLKLQNNVKTMGWHYIFSPIQIFCLLQYIFYICGYQK